ncbi:hypothetical protein BC827DRAFT_1160199 [Russula dissimulans]|nr:hypothetical protein BC827DRAFT_1160199 [Russula dissimulans]
MCELSRASRSSFKTSLLMLPVVPKVSDSGSCTDTLIHGVWHVLTPGLVRNPKTRVKNPTDKVIDEPRMLGGGCTHDQCARVRYRQGPWQSHKSTRGQRERGNRKREKEA